MLRPLRPLVAPLVASLVALPVTLALVAGRATAQAADGGAPTRMWKLEDRRYYDPHAAEPRAAQLNALALAFGKAVPWLQEQGDNRRTWDIDVGAEIPIVGWDRAASADKRVGPGELGIGTWITVDFHLFSDHVDPSSPILNTDYRFSGILKGQFGLAQDHWLGARVQVGHESTHLGDEYSLAARRLFADFERINVSYEFVDAGLAYDAIGLLGATSEVTVRLGTIFNLKGSYYKGDTLETAGRVVTPSVNRYEPYLGLQWRADDAARGVPGFRDWGVYASLDLRPKTVYEYHRLLPNEDEGRQLSVNTLVGLYRSSQRDNILGAFSPYVRFYRGVNPHGQFRNQRDFWLYGVGIRVDR